MPILYGGTPEYAWVYKHIGIAPRSGRVRPGDGPNNIYEQWPALFAAVAARQRAGRCEALVVRRWAPLAFELARRAAAARRSSGAGQRRGALPASRSAVRGPVAWVGQDYLSPQAFGYLLWLGVVLIIVRWLLAPPAAVRAAGRLAAAARAAAARAATRRPRPRRRRAARRGRARRRDLLRDRRRAPAHARTWRSPRPRRADLLDLLRPRWLVPLTGGDRGRLPGAPLRPDLAPVRRPVQRRQPDPNASGVRGTPPPAARRRRRRSCTCWPRPCGCPRWLRRAPAARRCGRVRDPRRSGLQPVRDPRRAELRRRGDLPCLPVLLTLVRAADRRSPGRAARRRWRLPISGPRPSCACARPLAAGLQGLLRPGRGRRLHSPRS